MICSTKHKILPSIIVSSKFLIFIVVFTITASMPFSKVAFGINASNNNLTLFDPHKKDIAMKLLSSAENGSTDWRAQYSYIQDIEDGRGYTAGIAGFCSSAGDMLTVVQEYTQVEPNNILAKYIPALQQVYGSPSHEGLDPNFVIDWREAANDPVFQLAQDSERDDAYFDPAVTRAISDGLGPLGQFIYFDAIVMHGSGKDPGSFDSIRARAMSNAKTPAQGGNETIYLNTFLDSQKAVMLSDPAHTDTSRVDTEQRIFLQQGNLNLTTPLSWQVYGNQYTISQ
jgi:chitosanase